MHSLEKIKNVFKNKKIVFIALITVLAAVFLFWLSSDIKNKEKSEARRFEEEKRMVEENRIKNEEWVKMINEQLEQEGKTQFKDVIEITDDYPIKRSCEKLRNRESIIITNEDKCTYRLVAKGEISMAVVIFVENDDYAKSLYNKYSNPDSSPDNTYEKLSEILNNFLNQQASNYDLGINININSKFLGPIILEKDTYPTMHGNFGSVDVNKLNDVSQENGIILEDYDLVHYIFVGNSFRSFATPASHKAYSYIWDPSATAGTFVHETMHLLGAEDKYFEDYMKYEKACPTKGYDPFNESNKLEKTDIMCGGFVDSEKAFINQITAREIGWNL